eukprot:gb/GECG01013282.1/.p1 GENE.gb/GECG01013282.1/~~gb/GECG01013282.1/.p1  ORF type:complete len:206 (+),score=21.08 gb/GECG01013282.1/:1-618(+)
MQQLALTARRMNNPTFNGWVFEHEVIGSAKKKEELSLEFLPTTNLSPQIRISPGLKTWMSLRIVSGPIQDLVAVLPLEDTNVLWVPSKWNQGTFDLVLLERTETDGDMRVIFLQVTLGETHGGKTEHLEDAIQTMEQVEGLRVSGYVVVYVEPEGHGSPAVTFDGGLGKRSRPRLNTLWGGQGQPDVNVQYATIRSKFVEALEAE